MIQIYLPDNTDYEHNGDMVLEPISCECEMVLNDEWHLELEHPIDEDGKFKTIVREAVISAPTPMGERQLFRIYETQKNDDTVTAYAFPVFFDSKDDHILLDVRPTGKSGQEALDIMCAKSKYRGSSDITTGTTAYYVRKNLMEAINGDIDQSFINRWGGEILYDNYRVIINQRVGGDYGVRAEFGYNLEGIEEHVDMSEVITRIIPVAYNGHTLDGVSPWVDSPRINNYAKIYTKEIYFDDVKMIEDASEDEEGCLTLEELWHKLIIRCNELFVQGIDLPKISYDVNMVSLEGTEEYKEYEVLEKVGLGDTVHCKHRELGIETNARAISIKYDCIEKRNLEVVLGDYQKSAFDSEFETQKAIESVLDTKSKTVMAERVRGILDAVNTQLRLQSTVAKKVNGRAFEISDLDPESELYGCMIFGSQGLQIATERTADGRDWNWRTAITAKGVVADAIISGLLSDETGRNYWNLDTGEFRLSSEAFLVDDDNIEEYVNKKLETVRNITMILGNEYQGIPTDYQGNYAAFPIVQTTVQVLYGQIDVTALCQYTIQRSAGVTGFWDNTTKIYTVTGLTADTGWVDITAAYLGLFTVTKRFNMAKQKNGEPGAQGIPGENGAPGRTYFMEASTLVVKRSQDNSMAPNYITLSAYYRDGTATARTEYAGRYKIEESLDGATWTTVYTSSANEPSITHSLYSALATSAGGIIATASGKAIGIPRDVVALRCTLYAAGGTTQMLDMQSIAVVVDVDALTHEDIFSLLTKNGALQGIYMSGGQLYINGTYMRIGKIASKNGRVYFDLDNNVLACSKMVSADTGQSIQTVADVGYPAGTSSSSGSRLRVYPQGYEGSAIQIHADTSNKGYVEGPSERMDIKCADTKTVINMYPTYMKLSAYPEPGSSSAKYAQIGLYSTGSSYDTGHVEIRPRLDVKGPLKVSGTFTASGTKSRIVETENYSRRLQYCYEMATPMFGDLGQGVTDENGECCVSLDDVFAETVATGIEYQVFLQKEGPGDIWVGEKHSSYFIARGTENLKFAWEIKVKQKDFECMRLENADFEEEDVEAILGVYEKEYVAEVAQIIEEQEGLLYETT